MSWAKPMLLMVVLGGILYGVYVVLNKGPAPAPPAGISQGWDKPLDIQIGTVDGGGPGQIGVAPPAPGGGPSYTGSPPPGNVGGQGPSLPPGGTSGPGLLNAPPVGPDNASIAPPFTPSPAASVAPDTSAATIQPTEAFAPALAAAKAKCNEGRLVEALRMLTKWCDAPQLTSDESRQLNELLSQLAGTVVYSRQHLLQPAYKILPGDNLDSIAKQYNVPAQLLAKINGIEDPNRLTPGDELKVMRGPFNAKVDIERRQLTLTVEGCYAGRFALVGIGDRARGLEGQFEVGEKQLDLTGGPPAASTPIHHWVGIGNNLGIVGTADPASIHPSGVNLSARDAEDVYDILSMGSRVVVRR